MLGLMLLNDDDGSVIFQLISQYQRNSTDIVLVILRRWEGRQPVTWKTLTDTLRAVGLTELATCIETSLTSPHTTQQS